jgi:hypothetical protein
MTCKYNSMVYSKEEFQKHIQTIQCEGFKLKKATQAFLFIRKQKEKTETITISYRNYAPHGFYIDGVSIDIFFTEVENILEQFGLEQDYKSTFGKSLQNIEDINYQALSTEINSDESFSIVKKVIDSILEKGVMPFFQSFPGISEVANFLADKTVEEIVLYIQGGILLPKTALILKLANHPSFLSRLNEFRGILIEYASKNNKYQILLEKFEKLFEKDLKK